MELPSLSGAMAGGLLPDVSNMWAQLLAQHWAQGKRLHTLVSPPQAAASAFATTQMLLERFELREAVSEPFELSLQVLMLDAHVPLKALCGSAITLRTQLADGQHVHRSGIVTEVRAVHADGGFARKALRVRPWPALLGHTLRRRVWQAQSVIAIVDDVFSQHPDLAVWRWDEGVAEHVSQGLFGSQQGLRIHCAQYRESDLDLVQRLLAEEGIAWRVEERPDAPAGHGIVLFVRSQAQQQDPTSAGVSMGISAGDWGLGEVGSGIRFHASPGHDSQEEQDSIHALAHERRLGHTAHAVLGWSHMAHAAISAEVPSKPDWGPVGPSDDQGVGQLTTWLSQYDPSGGHVFGSLDDAHFAATLLQQTEEARNQIWTGRGSVRTLRAGTWLAVKGADVPELFVTQVHAVGANALPMLASTDDGEAPMEALADEDIELHALARRTGYACAFGAVPRQVVWRPACQDGTGLRLRPRPTAHGPQTAIVVGPRGQVSAEGADEIHTDALGRIRVRFHWQGAEASVGAEASDSCWLRVQQRLAGAGLGHQFIPRIGQEVLVGFLGNDIDQPVVLASLYNGQGESGIASTPGGAAPEGLFGGSAGAQASALASSTDHHVASQMNLIGEGAGGHSPAWHGGAPGAATEGSPAQANAAALSGIKSKEFGGSGHNQLVLDDTPQQLRARLHTTQAQTWLEMGHLLHQADNHRGSLRGQGLELRTDAWGGLRAARGVLLSTYSLRGAPGSGWGITPEPAGDNAAGIALARQMLQLTQAFHQAAGTHQTVGLATGVQASSALLHSLRGTDAHDVSLPQMSDPHIALVGKGGVGLSTGQDVHLSSQGVTTLASGQDIHWAVGGQARVHTAQAIGVLAGAMQPGGADGNGQGAIGKGLTLVAAQGAVDMQAQRGPAQVMARQTLEIKTAHGAVHIAAAKRVVLAVGGGAGITLADGRLTVQCPGKITVKASSKSMVGPGCMEVALPILPSAPLRPDGAHDQFFVLRWANSGKPMASQPFRIRRANGQIQTGVTDAQGRSPLLDTASHAERLSVEILRSQIKA